MKTLKERLAAENIGVDEEIAAAIGKMSLERKVGQLFMLAFGGDKLERACAMIEKHYLGGCYISDANAGSPEKAAMLSATLQRRAIDTFGFPLLLGVDQEGAWGVMMPASTTGPGNLGLGAAHDPELTSAMYGIIGEELMAVGYNTLLAPCADVNSNPENPIIGMRSFGARPAEVSAHVVAAISGASGSGAITTVKHFPGHGNTAQDSHRGIPRVDRDLATLQDVDLAPFAAGIRAGVDIVMTSHILYSAIDPEMPATLSRPVVTGLLRGRMGFRGVVLSDSMNMRAMRRHYEPGKAAVMALSAGVDMIMLAEEHYDHDAEGYEVAQVATIDGVLDAVKNGELEESVVDLAAYRILALKKRRNIVAGAAFTTRPADVGMASHREVEDRISSKTVCVLRSAKTEWPIRPSTRIALLRLVPRQAYKILTATRGIGPNQELPAFDAFREQFIASRPDAEVMDYYDEKGIAKKRDLRTFDAIVAVTEDYPLPGIDFDTADQKRAVVDLSMEFGSKLIVIGLRTPYELSEYPHVETYVTTCSSRPCAARAAAKAAAGLIPASGISPV